MLTQREWDIAELESQMRVQGWFQEWVEALMEGRNPTDQLAQMSPQDAVALRDGPPPEIVPSPEEATDLQGGAPPQLAPSLEEEI